MSGDTGPTDKLWKVLNKTPNLKALLLETSFPNKLQELADISGHLTPADAAAASCASSTATAPTVLLYHLKPAFVAQLKRELAELRWRCSSSETRFEF